ncbi:MAG: DUF5752 family protein [Ilumatobacteraceae bacterium]
MSAPPSFRAVALDYDGTLTTGARPDGDVLAALAEVRAAGVRLVLVTGRILAELRHVFADVDDHVDAIVAENGTVVAGPMGHRRLVAPVPPELEDALTRRGVPVRGGEVLLACDAVHGGIVLEEIHRLGLDCQVLYNRSALMVVPAGTSKGAGLRRALGDLGVSPHDAIAVGDAENDHALFDACEVGVAVANAVPSLAARADITLAEADGAGVAALLRGPVVRGDERVWPTRWQVPIGRRTDGTSAHLPGARANVLVVGGSNAGKSYVGGLFAEGLLDLGYTVVVIDVEGDHAGLGSLPGVLLMGGPNRLPTPEEISAPICRAFASVVVDLSMLVPAEQDAFVASLLEVVDEVRGRTGLPHWVIVDEAHRPFGTGSGDRPWLSASGHCLITWDPSSLHPEARSAVDVVLALPSRPDATGPGSEPGDETSTLLAAWPRRDDADPVAAFGELHPGQALLVGPDGGVETITLTTRRTTHVRHWHKYALAELPADKRFRFRDHGGVTGQVAANTVEFHHIVRLCDASVVDHHLRQHDFSRWARDSLQDAVLAATFAAIERDHAGDVGPTRDRVVRAVEDRYRAGPETA